MVEKPGLNSALGSLHCINNPFATRIAYASQYCLVFRIAFNYPPLFDHRQIVVGDSNRQLQVIVGDIQLPPVARATIEEAMDNLEQLYTAVINNIYTRFITTNLILLSMCCSKSQYCTTVALEVAPCDNFEIYVTMSMCYCMRQRIRLYRYFSWYRI